MDAFTYHISIDRVWDFSHYSLGWFGSTFEIGNTHSLRCWTPCLLHFDVEEKSRRTRIPAHNMVYYYSRCAGRSSSFDRQRRSFPSQALESEFCIWSSWILLRWLRIWSFGADRKYASIGVHDFDEMREIQRTWKFELLSFRLVALALNGQPKIVVRLVLKRHLVFECLFDLRVLLALGIMFMNARGGSCGGYYINIACLA